MNEFLIILAILIGVLGKIFLKSEVKFKLPEIKKYEDGTRVVRLNVFGTIVVGVIAGYIVVLQNPEAYTSLISIFLGTYGGSSLIENIGTYVTPNNIDEEEA